MQFYHKLLHYRIKIMSYLSYKHLFQSVVCQVCYRPFEKRVPSERNVEVPVITVGGVGGDFSHTRIVQYNTIQYSFNEA